MGYGSFKYEIGQVYFGGEYKALVTKVCTFGNADFEIFRNDVRHNVTTNFDTRLGLGWELQTSLVPKKIKISELV